MDVAADQFEFFQFPVLAAQKPRSALRELFDVIDQHGPILSQAMVAKALGVSGSRVGQFVDDGRLATVELHGKRMVTLAALDLFLTEERKNGRPYSVAKFVSDFQALPDSQKKGWK